MFTVGLNHVQSSVCKKQKPDNKHVRVNDLAELTPQPYQSHRKQDNPELATPVELKLLCYNKYLF